MIKYYNLIRRFFYSLWKPTPLLYWSFIFHDIRLDYTVGQWSSILISLGDETKRKEFFHMNIIFPDIRP